MAYDVGMKQKSSSGRVAGSPSCAILVDVDLARTTSTKERGAPTGSDLGRGGGSKPCPSHGEAFAALTGGREDGQAAAETSGDLRRRRMGVGDADGSVGAGGWGGSGVGTIVGLFVKWRLYLTS
uniref:DUF834 domain-containing protein n=1 Tax=Oryza punctata TaxID=4537 RepID=A0A0E0JUQ9_ORYPU